MRKRLFLLAFFLFLPPPVPVFAQEGSSDLRVTSHLIQVNQMLREEKTFYYGVAEEMTIENRGATPYQGDLAFWVGDGEDLRVLTFQDGNDIDLEATIKEGIAYARLGEDVFIQPRQEIEIGFDYKVFFIDEKKKEEFAKKILYPHAEESLQFKVNPIENLGFRPQLQGFSFSGDVRESGWFVSPTISPKVGEVYRLRIVKEREESGVEEGTSGAEEREEAAKEEERGPVVIAEELGKIPERASIFLKRWIWENILLVLLFNDVLVLGLVGYKRGWFKNLHFKTARLLRLKLPKRKKSGKKRRTKR